MGSMNHSPKTRIMDGLKNNRGLYLIAAGVFFLIFQHAMLYNSRQVANADVSEHVKPRIARAEYGLVHAPTQCHFVKRADMKGKSFFADLEPAYAPEFTLLSAWLKPEYPSAVEAPKEIPEIYKDGFTMGGKVKIGKWYFNQAYLGNVQALPQNVWTKADVEDYMVKTLTETKYDGDGLNINTALAKYNQYVKGKRGVVIGSEHPWVEAMALRAGSGPILTVEFGEIISEHPMISTMIPKEFTESFLNGKIEPFDYGISFSSLEHDGLGRYGDILNPIGDLQSLAKALSYIKPGGFFFLGLMNGDDEIVFNAHRIYGKLRMPKIMAGWHFVDVILGGLQHTVVMQNRNGCI
uniref:Uncharacterized protein n=2 Tax=Spongospora subterranea TaxID=70186 RepID=A0A0H5R8F4_9EUKA|eukprot:CRZ10413.1 hypothetical protein [Spongospora subterranea]